jgi:hypothetical protein
LAPGRSCLPGGDEGFVVDLLDRSEVVRGLLHAGEQVLRALGPGAVGVRLQGRCLDGGGRGRQPCSQHGGGVEVEDQHQHVEERERRETLMTLQAAHVLVGDGLAEEPGAPLCHRLLREAVGLPGLLEERAERECGPLRRRCRRPFYA